MSDAVVDDALYHDNTITLNGVELIVEGPIRAGMVSEFSTGLKIGKATYDEREHAFWIALDDFSGGFGFRQAEVREAGGTHWDNPGGVDLRRPRHITLPPLRSTVNPDNDPGLAALFYHYDSMLVSDVGGTEYLQIAILDDIFTLDASRATLTRRYDGSADFGAAGNQIRFGRIVEGRTATGTRFLLATGSSGTGTHEYMRSTNGTTWTKSSDLPATPAANTSMQLSDAFVWDGLVVAHGEGTQIIGSADGIAWDEDAGGALDSRWWTGDIAARFIGVAMAPWGASALYFLAEGKLWVLDWYVYNAVEITDVGDGNWLHAGVVWNGSIFVTDNWNVWEYNPGNAQTVRRIGMFGKDGPPPSWTEDTGHPGTPNDYAVIQFMAGTSDLFAVCRSLAGTGVAAGDPSWRIAVYNGVGWSWLGPEVSASQPYAALVDRFPLNVSLTVPSRYIDVAALDDQTDTNFTLHLYHLPTTGDIPSYGGSQTFEDGPLAFETGWFDGGFMELEGALLKMSLDGYNLSTEETVRVEYRLNNDEQAAYINLATFTQSQQEVWFTSDHQGVAFKSVQFRVTLDRGTTTTRTPELRALVLLFDKVPHIRTAWTVPVDVTKTVARHLLINEEEATTERIWQFLKSLVNTPRLIRLVVPSMESGGVNVRITDLPANITEFRAAVGGKGVINLQLIEPVVA